MNIDTLTALSPLDGRYQQKLQNMANVFSEKSLIWHRLWVEIRWLRFLSEHQDINECPILPQSLAQKLDTLLDQFSLAHAKEIKQLEVELCHDVKAVEVFLAQQLGDQYRQYQPWIHFACTSEDINNVAYSAMLKKGLQQVVLPELRTLLQSILQLAQETINIPILALTHGQPATPTTFGREMSVYAYRLAQATTALTELKYFAKFNGATGGFNAHSIAYPDLNWCKVNAEFITNDLELCWNPASTQIEPHDFIAKILHHLTDVNSILLDLSKDFWMYISRSYLILEKENVQQVGSSTMPHKINPIQFENAEGNLGLSSCIAQHLATKLPQSRLQRDLSDSTVMRNLGSCLGYAVLAHQQLNGGLKKVKVNQELCSHELDQHWEILGEALQTVMRKHGMQDAYTTIKKLTQGKKISKQDYTHIVEHSQLPQAAKNQLQDLSPSTYIGQPNLVLHEAEKAVNRLISICEKLPATN